MGRLLGSAVFILTCGVLLLGCKPKAGGSCSKEGAESCVDKQSALVCHDGKWEAMPCRGTGGCSGAGEATACDTMHANENDVCNLDGDYACSVDNKAFLTCAKHKWSLAGSCRGTNGCQVNTKNVKCDSSIAKVDDACMKDDEGSYACADDKTAMLVCKTGKYIHAGKCNGPQHCRTKPDGIDCDDSVSELGDPCHTDNHYACAKDGKMLLVCKAGKFTKDETCKAKTTCRIQGDKVGCL